LKLLVVQLQMKLYNFKNGCNFFLKLWPSCNEVGNTS
jgi:hypothetical protein